LVRRSYREENGLRKKEERTRLPLKFVYARVKGAKMGDGRKQGGIERKGNAGKGEERNSVGGDGVKRIKGGKGGPFSLEEGACPLTTGNKKDS